MVQAEAGRKGPECAWLAGEEDHHAEARRRSGVGSHGCEAETWRENKAWRRNRQAQPGSCRVDAARHPYLSSSSPWFDRPRKSLTGPGKPSLLPVMLHQ